MKYSIILPVYNSEESIKRCVDSILAQTYRDWELIVVNDGSTDLTADILKNNYSDDERIKIITKKNEGPGIARNVGIYNATGDYIVFIDSDDYIDNDFLSKVDVSSANGKNDLIFIDVVSENKDKSRRQLEAISKYKNFEKCELIELQISAVIPFGAYYKAVRKSIAQNAEYSSFSVGEEAIYSYEVLKHSERIAFMEGAFYHYVYNPTGQHKEGGLDPWWPVLLEMKKHLCEEGEHKRYKEQLSSFAAKAFSISAYRISNNADVANRNALIAKTLIRYDEEFQICNTRFSGRRIEKNIIRLVKFKQYWVIRLASRLRRSNNGQ